MENDRQQIEKKWDEIILQIMASDNEKQLEGWFKQAMQERQASVVEALLKKDPNIARKRYCRNAFNKLAEQAKRGDELGEGGRKIVELLQPAMQSYAESRKRSSLRALIAIGAVTVGMIAMAVLALTNPIWLLGVLPLVGANGGMAAVMINLTYVCAVLPIGLAIAGIGTAIATPFYYMANKVANSIKELSRKTTEEVAKEAKKEDRPKEPTAKAESTDYADLHRRLGVEEGQTKKVEQKESSEKAVSPKKESTKASDEKEHQEEESATLAPKV